MSKPIHAFKRSVFALALSIAGCSYGGDADGDPVVIQFAARANTTPIDCTSPMVMFGNPPQVMRIADFRLFVSDFWLVNADGDERRMLLDSDGKWQNENTALLDFENKMGPCADGTKETNTTVRGSAPEGTTAKIRFTVGVPFAQNHQLPSSADAPLNLGAMHWDWQAGYKFARIDLENMAATSDWLIHLGSTGCISSAASVAPSTECTHPNRATITLPFDPERNTVVLDLAALLASSNLAFNTPETGPGCMSGHNDPECAPLFTNLGLDPSTGLCVNGCAAQTFFRTE
jgi:uncharacterized repeat protein (TIGR04052 family)